MVSTKTMIFPHVLFCIVRICFLFCFSDLGYSYMNFMSIVVIGLFSDAVHMSCSQDKILSILELLVKGRMKVKCEKIVQILYPGLWDLQRYGNLN